MNSEKSKVKKGQARGNRWLFVLLWIVGHALAWGVFSMVQMIPGFAEINLTEILLAMGLVVGGITSLTQYLLIRWQFGRNIKWWMPISLIAWVFAILTPFQASLRMGDTQFEVTAQLLALYVPIAVVQMVLLRKHVRQSWLWLVATLAGSSVFALSLISLQEVLLWAPFVAFGAYASITALSLLWLFGMSKPEVQQSISASSYERLSDETDEIANEDVEYDVKKVYQQES